MRQRAPGWSLVELMAVLVLASVLAFLAAPGLGQMIRNYRLDAAVADLYGAVDLTRTQAIARGRRVMLVPLEPGGNNWASGWLVFVDTDGDRRPGPGEELIASHGPVAEGIVITARFTSNKLPHYLAYGPSGRSCTDTSSMAARWGTLSFHQQGEIRHIKINMLGRARVCRPDVEGAGCEG
ncbi:GspH/FimT family pseudopilin [Massilia sp. PAMC28688]|uniref:GspH/FimT family pseudopilin n=1 Tax=Massilia sp. PAMC28688 TaxID=2861283 RepID=UPI001C628D5F|nr:GspH/FimT family pseudopilin [Massilia sp. PAMC28688]QYF93885.1 GspH/FimT family pseudopilin [Massilia sp. PAMC28688]